jgi:hypothetical protein
MNNMESKFTYHPDGKKPPVDDKWIFVFGSNQAGRHGSGAAKEANLTYGAVMGTGVGRMGHSFAIPTCDYNIQSRPLAEIEEYVKEVFLPFAAKQSGKLFYMTRVGCVLAGHTNADIAPLFKNATKNVIMPEPWREFLE